MAGQLSIGFVVDNLGIGGTELNAVRTAELLVGRGHQIILFTLGSSGPLRSRYEASGIRVVDIPLQGFLTPSLLDARQYFRRSLIDHAVSVIHAHDYYSNVFAAIAAPVRLPKIIMSRRWWHSPSATRRILGGLAYRRAHRVLANSPSVGRLLVDQGVSPARIVVVPNFVDDDAFTSDTPLTHYHLRQELGIPLDAILFGMVARLSREKGHEVLLRAYDVARHSLEGEHHLVLIGGGPEEQSLRSLAEALGLSGNVHFAGHRTARPNLHSSYDVSVLSSLSEGFPNSIIEAMAASRPVIASRVGGIPDAIVHGKSGLLVPPSDVKLLADALCSPRQFPEMRRSMGSAAFEAASHYRAQPVIDALEALYRSLLLVD